MTATLLHGLHATTGRARSRAGALVYRGLVHDQDGLVERCTHDHRTDLAAAACAEKLAAAEDAARRHVLPRSHGGDVPNVLPRYTRTLLTRDQLVSDQTVDVVTVVTRSTGRRFVGRIGDVDTAMGTVMGTVNVHQGDGHMDWFYLREVDVYRGVA